jgi:hypothetical protein
MTRRPTRRLSRGPSRPAGIRRRPVLAASLAAAGLAAAGPGRAPAQDGPLMVDVELVLAADGSGSIDDDELRAQREGYAAAITSDRVLSVILGGFNGRIAIAYVEWGGASSQHTIVDWTLVDGPEAAGRFAEALVATPRAAFGWNSISNALDYSRRLVAANAYEGFRKVVDVSADSGQRGGRPLPEVRAELLADGFTINALSLDFRGRGLGGPGGVPLAETFRRTLIGGPGAFVLPVTEESQLTEAIIEKLVLEIAGRPAAPPALGPLPA